MSAWQAEKVAIRAGVLAVCLLAAAGCGSGSADTVRRATVPAYDHYPPNTITTGDESSRSATCRGDARAFVSISRLYLAHLTALSAYPPDVEYMNMRQDLTDFAVRGCDEALLGEALAALSPKQRAALVGSLPRPVAATLRRALAAARG